MSKKFKTPMFSPSISFIHERRRRVILANERDDSPMNNNSYARGQPLRTILKALGKVAKRTIIRIARYCWPIVKSRLTSPKVHRACANCLAVYLAARCLDGKAPAVGAMFAALLLLAEAIWNPLP